MNTVLLCNLFSLPRIVYAMAEDGLFFSIFARVNPITKVPVNAILVFGILMATMALIFDLEALVQFLSIGTLLAYTFVAASVIVLRFQPDKGSLKGTTSTSPNPNADPSPAPLESQTITEENEELKQYESFSDKLQLVERQKAREKRGVGQLRACWEPYLDRVLGDCEPGEGVAFSVMTLIVSSVSLCAVLEFGNNQLQLPTWSFTMLLVIFSLAFILSLVLIWVHEPQRNNKTFQVKLYSHYLSMHVMDIIVLCDIKHRLLMCILWHIVIVVKTTLTVKMIEVLLLPGTSCTIDSRSQYPLQCISYDEAQPSNLDSIHRLDCHR